MTSGIEDLGHLVCQDLGGYVGYGYQCRPAVATVADFGPEEALPLHVLYVSPESRVLPCGDLVLLADDGICLLRGGYGYLHVGLHRPRHGEECQFVIRIQSDKLGLGDAAVYHRLGSADVLRVDDALGILFGDRGRFVEEFDRHPGIAVIRGDLGDHPNGVLRYPPRDYGLIRPRLDDVVELVLRVSVEPDLVRLAECGQGCLIQQSVQTVLGYHYQGDFPHVLVTLGEARQLVDEVCAALLQEQIHLIQDDDQSPGVGGEVVP